MSYRGGRKGFGTQHSSCSSTSAKNNIVIEECEWSKVSETSLILIRRKREDKSIVAFQIPNMFGTLTDIQNHIHELMNMISFELYSDPIK